MKFLVDRCAGRRLADWLQTQGHEVIYAPSLGPDPGDRALLGQAVQLSSILITIDTDFGELLFVEGLGHCGLVRLPDVPASKRILLMSEVIRRHERELQAGAIVTVRGDKIRVSMWRPDTQGIQGTNSV